MGISSKGRSSVAGAWAVEPYILPKRSRIDAKGNVPEKGEKLCDVR
jgi:hypothetical protein